MHFAQERRPKYKYYKLQHAGAAGNKKKEEVHAVRACEYNPDPSDPATD
jgi:hypothetical protein